MSFRKLIVLGFDYASTQSRYFSITPGDIRHWIDLHEAELD